MFRPAARVFNAATRATRLASTDVTAGQAIVQQRNPESKKESVSLFNGMPPVQMENRVVRVTRPAKTTTQSGSFNAREWELTWDTPERWENPLMGWASTADPLSNLKLNFDTKEEAISFCEKNGYRFYVAEPQERPWIKKTYGDNFHWFKNTRVNTK